MFIVPTSFLQSSRVSRSQSTIYMSYVILTQQMIRYNRGRKTWYIELMVIYLNMYLEKLSVISMNVYDGPSGPTLSNASSRMKTSLMRGRGGGTCERGRE